MFCIKCGSPAVADNFCRNCFLEKRKMFEVDGFIAYVCKTCGNYKDGDIENQIRTRVKQKGIVKSCSIKMRAVGNRIYANVLCRGFIPPLKKIAEQESDIIISIKKKMCDACIKKSGGYYEAALQVRGEKKNDILRKVRQLFSENEIADIKILKEGYDVRVIDKKIAGKVAAYLRESFSIKESYKLVGDKKGKKLYRNFYAVR